MLFFLHKTVHILFCEKRHGRISISNDPPEKKTEEEKYEQRYTGRDKPTSKQPGVSTGPTQKIRMANALQAGMCAPFAQAGSRHFTFIQNQDMILRLNKSAKDTAIAMEIPGLSQLAQNPDFHCTYRAPSLILLSGKSDTISPEAGCAAAAENILIARKP